MTLEEAAAKYRVQGIPAPLIERFWPLAEPYIKRALDRASGEFLPSDIKTLLKDKLIQLWLVSENERIIAAVTTEIVNYPQRKHCRVITLGGSKASEWVGLIDTIVCAWAKENGCVAMDASVRQGLVPSLKELGYTAKSVIVVKEIP